jgi:membrane protein CcdC involved in cytochrome C biogenesis
MNYQYLFIILIIALVLWRRTRSFNKPVKGNGWRLLIPLVFVSIGLLNFMNPQVHLTTLEVVSALLLGFIMSIPLIITTNYEQREDGSIYPKKSHGFIIVLVGLVIIRLSLHHYITGIDPINLSVLFFTVAIGYLYPWRIISFIKFRKIYKSLKTTETD